jgi:hypothetical protein
VLVLALGIALLYAPFAAGDQAILRWTWPVGAILLFLAVRGLGAAATEQMDEQQHAGRDDTVGSWLGRLGGKAHVLRYVAVGGRSVEYVVVAPSGVYAIRTRSNRGKIAARGGELLLNGRPLPREVLVASRNEASAVEERLASLGFGYPVKPVIVFTDARTDVRQVGEVTAMPLRWLESFIREQPGMMSQLESSLIASALRRDARASLTR